MVLPLQKVTIFYEMRKTVSKMKLMAFGGITKIGCSLTRNITSILRLILLIFSFECNTHVFAILQEKSK